MDHFRAVVYHATAQIEVANASMELLCNIHGLSGDKGPWLRVCRRIMSSGNGQRGDEVFIIHERHPGHLHCRPSRRIVGPNEDIYRLLVAH